MDFTLSPASMAALFLAMLVPAALVLIAVGLFLLLGA
jgi:nitrogen fixation-related uncharacterized protein